MDPSTPPPEPAEALTARFAVTIYEPPAESPTEPVVGANFVAQEVATQTPTSERCDSPPWFLSTDGYLLKGDQHGDRALQAMYRMRCNGAQLCDIHLKVGLDTFSAHKVVLAATSSYFNAMFNGEMREQTATEVQLHGMDASAISLLIDYAYTGEIVITSDNVQLLLPASSALQMEQVREACCTYLLRQLHPSNCLGIRTFADTHSCRTLFRRSHLYALQQFGQVVRSDEFLALPLEQVQQLVADEHLNVSAEEDVFVAVISWIKHDLTSRSHLISKLMEHVRLPLVKREFLMSHVDAEPLVRENSECRDFLLDAMRYHLAPEKRFSLSGTRTAERKPKGAQPYLFAIGGGSLFSIHAECEMYNPRTDRWTSIKAMQWRRSRAGVTGLRRLLYAVGGYDGASDQATAECYSPLTNTWTSITPMGTKRSCLGTCAFDGLIYVCGGYDGASCLSSMERFDPLTGVWCSCPAMNTRRRYCRITVIENAIYALGGFDSTNYQASVERLDPREGIWTPVPSMSSRRSSCGVAALENYLYCIGGNDGTMCMSSGERFDVRSNQWEAIASMHNRRSTHEVVSTGGYIYAIGGNDGSSSLSTVERYEPTSNQWTLVQAMGTRRSSVGAAILECINLESVVQQSTDS